MNEDIHCIKLYNIYGSTGGNYAGNVYDIEGLAPALNDMQGGNRQPLIEASETSKIIVGGAEDHLKIRNANQKGYDEAYEGDSVNLTYPSSTTRRGRVGHEVAQTIQSSDTQGVVSNNLRIRKLTPKECWRLMGFSDEEFEKARAVNSDTQLYKQAGNSIVVDVLEAILRNLLTSDRNEKDAQMTMFGEVEKI